MGVRHATSFADQTQSSCTVSRNLLRANAISTLASPTHVARTDAFVLLAEIVVFVCLEDFVYRPDRAHPARIDPDCLVANALDCKWCMADEQQCAALVAELDHSEHRFG